MITILYNYFEKNKVDFLYNLTLGLVIALISNFLISNSLPCIPGLILCLISGFMSGLLSNDSNSSNLKQDLISSWKSGLICSLIFGLLFGYLKGLLNLSQLIPINIISITALITGTIILAEILISFVKKEKKISWLQVIWIKTDAILLSALIIINCLNIIWVLRHITKDILLIILRWIGYIGAGLIVLALLAGIIYLWLLWNKMRLTK